MDQVLCRLVDKAWDMFLQTPVDMRFRKWPSVKYEVINLLYKIAKLLSQ
jgi:hypothetical protein